MGALDVGVGAEGVELQLEHRQGVGPRLLAEIALQGLMETLDLAARLWMVGRRVVGHDTESLELALEPDLAAARAAGEDRTVGGE